MKICMVAYSFYDADNRVMRYAETLARRGDDVEVIALRKGGDSRECVKQGVRIFQIQERERNEKGAISYLFRVLSFMLHATWLVSVRHIRKRYQFIHVHSVPDFLIFTALLPRLMGARIVLDIHDILPEFYASKFGAPENSFIFRLLVWVERLSAAMATHVVVANHLWHKRLVNRSVDETRCTTILNAPDRRIFSFQPRTQENDQFIIIYPGTLNVHQGLDVAVRAMQLVRDEVPNSQLHIYGDGPSRNQLMHLSSELQLADHVKFYSPRPLREIARIVANANLGIVPKRSDSFGNEAFSTKILEFMAVGVPVLAAETTIDRYYFDDSIIRFFRNGDVQDLANCIIDLAKDAESRDRLVRNALKYVEQHDWKSFEPVYLRIVDDTLAHIV